MDSSNYWASFWRFQRRCSDCVQGNKLEGLRGFFWWCIDLLQKKYNRYGWEYCGSLWWRSPWDYSFCNRTFIRGNRYVWYGWGSFPTSAFYAFNKNAQDKIKNAKQGATVKIETSRWISFHKMVMQALADRPDVSLEVSFLDGEYKGNRLSFTIPAGTDTLSLLDENGFSGFLYLAGKFGTAN